MMKSPDLSVIIVSWNVRELLESCLASIRKGQGELLLEVIVVDAGSSDNSAEMVRQKYPETSLIERADNVGFPKGNNIGMRVAKGRYILLLNPDTEVIDNALLTMVAYMENHRDVGVVGGKLIYPDGSIQSSRRRFPNLITGLFESTWLEPFAPNRVLEQYYAQDLAKDKPVDVDWLMGACLMVRSEVVGQIGLMDEAYFMYSEELDWCRRIKEANWRVIYLPSAVIMHHEGKSSEQAVVSRHINYQRAKLRYFRKYHGQYPAALIRIVLLFNYFWQMVLEATKGIVGHKRELRWQRVRAYWQVLRSGLRPAGY